MALASVAAGTAVGSATTHTITMPTPLTVGNWLVVVVGIDSSATAILDGFDAVPILKNERVDVNTSVSTGDYYQLSFNGATTGNLTYPIASASVTAALEGLSTIGTGNADFYNGQDGTSTNIVDYGFEFIGNLGGKDVGAVTAPVQFGTSVGLTTTAGGTSMSSIINSTSQWFVFKKQVAASEPTSRTLTLSGSSYAVWSVYQLSDILGVGKPLYRFWGGPGSSGTVPGLRTPGPGLDIICNWGDGGVSGTVPATPYTWSSPFTGRVGIVYANVYRYIKLTDTTIEYSNSFAIADTYRSLASTKLAGAGWIYSGPNEQFYMERLFIPEVVPEGGTGWGITT